MSCRNSCLKAFSDHFETHVVLRKVLGIDYKTFDEKYREYLKTKYAREVRVDRLREPDFYGSPLTRGPGGLPESNTSPVFTPDLKTRVSPWAVPKRTTG